MSDLIKLIQAYLTQANIRGVDRYNPIPFMVRSPEGQPNQGKTFVIQVGYDEPTFNQLPYNVLWVCFDKTSPSYAKLFRRVSHTQSPSTPEFEYTWEEITEYETVFAKEQFYKSVADLELVEATDSADPILVASPTTLGTVLTSKEVIDPIAVSEDDERLTDKRVPTSHNHDDAARTMLKTFEYDAPLLDESGDPVVIDGVPQTEVKRAYVEVGSLVPPTAGSLLFIKAQKSEHVWEGEWRKPTLADVTETGPQVVSSRIIEPTASYQDNRDYQFGFELEFDDGSKLQITNDVDRAAIDWSVSANPAGVTIDDDGKFTVPDLTERVQVDVTADVTYKGDAYTQDVAVTIEDLYTPVVPERIEISGPAVVQEKNTANYTVTLFYSDGSSKAITPDSFVANNTPAAIIEVSGLLTSYDVELDQPVKLTAQYTEDGKTMTDEFDMTVVAKVLDWDLEIRGASSMDEQTSETFEVWVVDEEFNETKVTPDTFRISAGSSNGSLSGMVLTASDITGNKTINLEAVYTQTGKTETVHKTISVRDLTVYPQSLDVTVQASQDENTAQEMVVEVVYTDGSRTAVTPSEVRVSNPILIYGAPLTLTAGTVLADTSVTVSVDYAESGVDLTKNVVVKVVNSESVLTGIEAQGATYVGEGQKVSFAVYLVTDDGQRTKIDSHTQGLTITPSVAFLTVEPEVNSVFVTAPYDVTANTPIEFDLTYELAGKTYNTKHTITALNSIADVTGLEVVGFTSRNEGETATLSLNLVKDDGSKESVTDERNAVVKSVTPNIGTVTKELGGIKYTAPTDVTENTVVTLEIEYDHNGSTLSATHQITVVNSMADVVGLQISGNSAVGEDKTLTLVPSLAMSDSSTQNIDVAAVTVTATPNNIGEITQNSAAVYFKPTAEITADTQVTLHFSYEHNGQTLTKDHEVTVQDTVAGVTGIEVQGTDTVNEGAQTTLELYLVRDDGSKTIVKGDVNTAIITQSPDDFFTISKFANNFVARAQNNLTQEETRTLTVKYTHEGTEYTTTFDVTALDNVPDITGWTIEGPDTIIVGRKFDDPRDYSISVQYDSGATTDDLEADEWRIADNANVFILNQEMGRVDFHITEKDVTANQTFTLEARYNVNGSDVWKQKVVTIKPQDISEITFEIDGDDSVNEGQTSAAYTGTARFNSRWVDHSIVLKTLQIVGTSHGCSISGNKLVVPATLTSNETIRLRGTFDWSDQVDVVSEDFVVNINNTIADFDSAKFVIGQTEFDAGNEINPTAVQVTMSNGAKQNLIASDITIVSGASAVDVVGTGSSTRFNVKSDLAADTSLTWSGKVLVNGILEDVDSVSVDLKKASVSVEVPLGVFGAPAEHPSAIFADFTVVTADAKSDPNWFELTDANFNQDNNMSVDLSSYPAYTGEAGKVYSTLYIIAKPEWGSPTIFDTNTLSPGVESNLSGALCDVNNVFDAETQVLDLHGTAFDKYADYVESRKSNNKPTFLPFEANGQTYFLYRWNFPVQGTTMGWRVNFENWSPSLPA